MKNPPAIRSSTTPKKGGGGRAVKKPKHVLLGEIESNYRRLSTRHIWKSKGRKTSLESASVQKESPCKDRPVHGKGYCSLLAIGGGGAPKKSDAGLEVVGTGVIGRNNQFPGGFLEKE